MPKHNYLPDLSVNKVAKIPLVRKLYDQVKKAVELGKLCEQGRFAEYEDWVPTLIDLCDCQEDDEEEEEEITLSSSEEAVVEEEQEEEEADTDDLVESDGEEEASDEE